MAKERLNLKSNGGQTLAKKFWRVVLELVSHRLGHVARRFELLLNRFSQNYAGRPKLGYINFFRRAYPSGLDTAAHCIRGERLHRASVFLVLGYGRRCIRQAW